MTDSTRSGAATAPRILMVFAALALVAAFFLPFISATDDYRERLLQNPDAVQYDKLPLTNAQVADLSLCEYALCYFQGESLGMNATTATFYAVLCGAPLVLAALALLLSGLGKPIGNIAMLAPLVTVVAMIVWDFGDRRIVYDGGNMAFGFAQYVYYAAAAISLVCSIWLFAEKRRAKKAVRAGS